MSTLEQAPALRISRSSDLASHSLAVEYVEVFAILIALTILTSVLSYINVGEAIQLPGLGRAANIFAGLAVAVAKCALVFWIFMHMNHETKLNRAVFIFSLALMLLFFFAVSCEFVWLHTYTVVVARAAVGGM